ncbi:MAG: hypothetical protein Q9217_005328 [Psora testacea]
MSTVLSRHVNSSAERTAVTNAASRPQDTLDASLDQLIKEVLPSSPYILRLQQSHGRRLPTPSQSYHWMQGTLFSPNEQELQYMTFRRSMDGMLHAHGQWHDGNGGIVPGDQSISQTSSGRTPLQSQGVKKKISLADYKNRDRNKNMNGDLSAAQQAQEATSTGPEQGGGQMKDIKNEDAHKVKSDNNMSIVGQEVEVTKQTGSLGKKRTADVLTATERPEAIELPSASPPAKKPRRSISSAPLVPRVVPAEKNNAVEAVIPKVKATAAPAYEPDTQSAPILALNAKSLGAAAIVSDAEVKAPAPKDGLKKSSGLPPMLSPTLPNVKSYTLPPLLSPTLPPEIEAALAKSKGTRAEHNGSFNTTSRAPNYSASSNRPKSDTVTSVSQVSSRGTAKSSSPTPATIEKQHKGKSSTSTSWGDAMQQGHFKDTKKPILWLRLKIKKKHRRELSQYLRLKPTPTKLHWKKQSPPQQRNVEDNSGATASSVTKRERPHCNEDDPGPHNKRRRESDNSVQRVETPGLPVSSPLPSNPVSFQKSRLAAPSNLPKSSAMRRAGSGQGSASTPFGQSRHDTPSSLGRESPLRHELRAEYRTESTRLVNLARGLKHDSDKYLKLEKASEEQQKLGVIIATESVLCFILAAVVNDEPSRRDGHAGNASQWKSILPLLRILTERAKPYQHIYGLLQQLEGVMRDTMHYYDLWTLRSILRDYERMEAVADQEAALQKNHVALKESYENEMRASLAWREGQSALWVTELQSAFPKTWSQARRFPGRGKALDVVPLKEYAKDGFALPMGPLTSGLEAVNFGLSLLVEHCEKEGIQWAPKLLL